MYRHLVERNPFELHVVSNADFADGLLVHTQLRLPYPLHRLRKSRFGPQCTSWLTDYENFVWTLAIPEALDKAIFDFKPDIILTLAETSLCHIAAKAAQKHHLPLAGLFLDWFPIMKPHYGCKWTQDILSRRYRKLYAQCDLAFCTSDGMQEVLGKHRNSHVIYPMPGKHRVPETFFPPKSGKFRLVYVGCVDNFYGRMICSLIEKIEPTSDLEMIVVGPNADWPKDILQRAKAKGIYLGFKPPEEAATVLAGADALLVVMSFEAERRRFMETSFTTKFLDYAAFGKPIVLWGPEYCTPARVVRRDGGAWLVDKPLADEVVAACRKIAADPESREGFARQAKHLHQGLFSPERLQEVFVSEVYKLIGQ
ncbi:MAG: glycosyltransferase [Negativicutes bacterium]|nr:glycosyltransferase [Negativicutes bacterium]